MNQPSARESPGGQFVEEKRCSKFWHVHPPGTAQISRVPLSSLLKELQEENYEVCFETTLVSG